LRAELRDTLKLAGPIVLNQVGHMSMGLVDTVVAGHISTTALAGLGLAANFYSTFTGVCLGCLFGLDTYFSQAVGARDEAGLARYLGQSFWSCLFVAALALAGVLLGNSIYFVVAPPGGIRDAFGIYIQTLVWCLPTIFFYFVLQRYWQAQHRVLPFTAIMILANVLNLGACLALGLGHWGFPRLEVKGLALATVISRYAMLLAALAFTWGQLRPASLRLPRVDRAVQRGFLRLGLPAAAHVALEIGAFTIAAFVVASLGPVPLAAHHLCLMMAAFTFMFPLGFSSAAAVRVGLFIGRGQPDRARLAGWLCIGVSISVMTCFALGYLTIPRLLLRGFTRDAAVIDLGAKILMLVALFQVADGTQVSTTGALRGLGNTRAAMVANLIGHYPIGLALGFVLCFGLNWGVLGMWTGLAAGLISVAALLVRAWTQLTKDLSQLTRLT
jgi:MATE family multidrug resistance protein